MKKFKFYFPAVIVLLSAGSLKVQGQKIGYISLQQVITVMPEAARIDSLMQLYQRDTINTEFNGLVQNYNLKDSLLHKGDTGRLSPVIKRQYSQDLEQLAYQIQNWQQIAQQAYQDKQSKLLDPVYQKLLGVVNAVSKENGYAFVFSKDGLIVAPPGDDLLPLVAKRLNLKMPANAQGQTANPAMNSKTRQ